MADDLKTIDVLDRMTDALQQTWEKGMKILRVTLRNPFLWPGAQYVLSVVKDGKETPMVAFGRLGEAETFARQIAATHPMQYDRVEIRVDEDRS